MRSARAITIAVAVAAFTMLLASGPGTRLGLWPWLTGLSLLKWATYTGLAAVVFALVQIVVPAWRRPAPWLLVVALALGAVAALPPILMMSKARSLPLIHDITTDTADPPAFVALRDARRNASNGADYGGEKVAAEQKRGYADIQPLELKAAPRDVLQKAIDAARAMGWEVAASDTAAGRIEATDTSTWFGFKDDIVVRIRAQGPGSRVDVRSASREGLSDLGVNAKRIREFLSRLA